LPGQGQAGGFLPAWRSAPLTRCGQNTLEPGPMRRFIA
jgi:hypothetical protein